MLESSSIYHLNSGNHGRQVTKEGIDFAQATKNQLLRALRWGCMYLITGNIRPAYNVSIFALNKQRQLNTLAASNHEQGL